MSLLVKEFTPPCLISLANALAFLLLAPGTILAVPENPAEPPTAQPQPTSKPANPGVAVGSPQEDATSPPAPSAAERDGEFKKLVTNVRLVGNFTIDGDTAPGAMTSRAGTCLA